MSEPSTISTIMEDMEAAARFSRATVAMVVTNPNLPDNPIVYVNEAFEKMTGYSRSAAIGRNCRFLQGKDTDEGDVAALHDAVAEAEEVSVDVLNYRANGEPFLNRLIIAPVFRQDGRIEYFVGIQKELREEDRDIADERTDARLKEIQRRVQSHLSMIIGQFRIQSRETTAPAEFAALSRRIECLQLLYEEMVAEQRGDETRVALGTYLARVANTIAHVEGRPGIRTVIDIEQMTAPVETAARIGLVLTEVLTNAFHHAFLGLAHGLVEVRMTRLSEGGLRLTVTDDGIGIPKSRTWPSQDTMGGRIVDGLIEGLDGTLVLGRGAAGTVITIDVPVGATTDD